MNLRTPAEITAASLDIGCRKASLPVGKLFIQSLLAGAFIAFGGILSIIVGYGFPEISASNPAMQRLMSGVMFPIGLILVVVLGAELFTGNNALLMPGLIKGRIGAGAVARNWTVVYIGNFAGCVAFAYVMVYLAGLTSAAPYHDAVIGMAQKKVALPWMVGMLRGIGANWCVCLAVWLALSGHNLLEKMAGCFFPVMAFVALSYEHCIANMFFIPLGMMEGAGISIGDFCLKNLVPVTIGNILGGALFVGSLNTWLHLKKTPEC